MPKQSKILLMDANVLIDYLQSDFSVLGLVNKHVGEVCVLTTIIDEVEALDPVDCERIGLKVIEPELAQLTLAATKRGRLSFADHLCLLVAMDGGFACVTNDKPLRNACTEEDVDILWGLEIMTALVRAGEMLATDVIQTAEKIHQSNPLHISIQLVDRFAKLVTTIERKRGKK